MTSSSSTSFTLFECAGPIASPKNGQVDQWPSRRASDAAESLKSCRILGTSMHLMPGSKAQVQLIWKDRPSSILLITKLDDEPALQMLIRVGKYLQAKGLRVFVEYDETKQHDFELFDINIHTVDCCACFGGDGTLLHMNSLFQDNHMNVPPVLAFAMGSLGFLTPHDASAAESCLETVLNGHVQPIHISLRMRLWCELVRAGQKTPEFRYQVLNECLLDRGGSSTMSSLELYVDDERVTIVQADGVIVSTPTGSTAYSMSAGGSMVAPTVPALLVTPVCPHTLSFRPAVLPDSSTIRLRVPCDARSTCCVSFDGGRRREVHRGDEVRLYMSSSPFPTISVKPFNTEWFNSIISKLHWNARKPQKALANL